MNNMKIRPLAFYPSLLILGVFGFLSIYSEDVFISVANSLHVWLLDGFGWMYLITAFMLVISCIFVYISPIGNLVIGGEGASKILSKWQWASITLCSSVAIGLLFFASAEPIINISYPSKILEGKSLAEVYTYSISAVYMHWSLTTYALYSIPALAFAIAYYNYNKDFSISSAMFVGRKLVIHKSLKEIIDSVALIALVSGMITSLGTSILMLEGGVNFLFETSIDSDYLALIAMLVMVFSTISAASGLQKGIAFLSSWNTKAFLVFSFLVLILGPTSFIAHASLDSLAMYISNFVNFSLDTGVIRDDSWPKDWTVFFWANWYAWAPIVAIFLGKISKGYTVKQFMVFNVVLPAIFVLFWCGIFGSYSIYLEITQDGLLSDTFSQKGPGAIIWQLLADLPFSTFFIATFLIISFVSYVTAADSSIDAISGTCINNPGEKSPLFIKLIWGGIIALLSTVLTINSGLDGLKLVSTIGGFFGMIIVLFSQYSLLTYCYIKSNK
ncbi:BCCT family transporter [Marinomonas atlantica]|uniref:BCCT family transporter n=1 Tax=Marinomonas atlantica TaxID=1806668 RepID=UPI00082FEAB9|nr:BCCT family transporter [Marinomonas atlantica]